MAIQKEIEIKVDTSQAKKGIDDVVKSVDNLTDETKKYNKTTQDGFEKTEKQIGNVEKAVGGLSNGFRAVGLAVKAMGVGLLLSAFETLKSLFEQNQKIADIFGTTMKALEIVFNDLFDLVIGNSSKVTKFFKDIFENPQKSIKDFGNLIKENLIERFNSAIEVVGFLSNALGSFFKGDFKKALESVKKAGIEMIDVYTGVDDSAKKIGNMIDAVVEYGSETFKTAGALQKLENQSKIAEARQRQLVLQYSQQAELLRQIRDDDTKTIAERIDANNKLGKVLERQGTAMKGLAAIQIQNAQNQFALNKSLENRVALIDAETNAIDVQEQVTGFLSEQKTNYNSLLREELDMKIAIAEGDRERVLSEMEANAELEKDELKKIDLLTERYKIERQLIEEDIEQKRELYKEGTQARVDAEIEYANKKLEIDSTLKAKEQERAKEEFDRKLEEVTRQSEDEDLAFQQRLEKLAERESLITESLLLSEKERADLLRENKEKEKQIEEEASKFKEENYQQNNDNIQNILSVGGKNLQKISKALALTDVARTAAKSVGETIASIGTANAKSIAASPLTGGMPFVAFNTIQGALQIGSTIANATKSIAAINSESKTVSGSSGGSAGGGGSAPTPPSFNLVQGTGTNQIAEGLARDRQPLKAYVVASEVSTQQALDRNIQSNASI